MRDQNEEGYLAFLLDTVMMTGVFFFAFWRMGPCRLISPFTGEQLPLDVSIKVLLILVAAAEVVCYLATSGRQRRARHQRAQPRSHGRCRLTAQPRALNPPPEQSSGGVQRQGAQKSRRHQQRAALRAQHPRQPAQQRAHRMHRGKQRRRKKRHQKWREPRHGLYPRQYRRRCQHHRRSGQPLHGSLQGNLVHPDVRRKRSEHVFNASLQGGNYLCDLKTADSIRRSNFPNVDLFRYILRIPGYAMIIAPDSPAG